MLTIVATPIGNLEDISLRALRVLKEADVIIAEDTRHTGLLLKHFAIPHKPMISLYDEVEGEKIQEILKQVQDDTRGVLVSDSGTPLVSDPGYKLVREALARKIEVDFVPGPTAVVAALVLSGLPPDKFTFFGFRDPQPFAPGTNIYFVSPYKLKKFLRKLDQNLEIVVARELTKIHQEIWRGKVADAIVKFDKPKGEFVVLWHN